MSPAKITFSGNDHELIFEAESVETAGCCIVQSRGAYAGWVHGVKGWRVFYSGIFYAISGIKKKYAI